MTQLLSLYQFNKFYIIPCTLSHFDIPTTTYLSLVCAATPLRVGSAEQGRVMQMQNGREGGWIDLLRGLYSYTGKGGERYPQPHLSFSTRPI